MSPSEISKRVSARRLAYGAVALGAIALVFAIAFGGATSASGSTATPSPGPDATTVVPTSIPPNGVNVNDQVILMPPASDDSAMDASAAIKTASQYAENGLDPEALLAKVTVPGTIPPPDTDIEFNNPIRDHEAWVVTFTSPAPMVFGGKYGSEGNGITVSHFSVVIDSDTGDFLIGFYTS